MGRADFIRQHSALAATAGEAIENPLKLISRPLYLPTDDQPKLNQKSWEENGWREIDPEQFYLAKPGEPAVELNSWELPSDLAHHADAAEYLRLLKGQRAFTIGGTAFLVEMGMPIGWFVNDDRRREAVTLMQARNWMSYLTRFEEKGKDSKDRDIIFGKNLVSKFVGALPPPKDRDEEATDPELQTVGRKRGQMGTRDIWEHHRIRLRKAIEFVALVEAIVAWRFANDESIGRFRRYLRDDSAAADATKVLDILWIEPIIYTIWPEPRQPDIARIWRDEQYRRRFREMVQAKHAGALYWLLRGAPGKLKAVQAACEICNDYYNGLPVKTRPVTAPAKEYKSLRHRLEGSTGKAKAPPDARDEVLDLRELGPETPNHKQVNGVGR